MQEFLQAFILIFIAEMGDKTQIMAMALATKFKTRHILWGVALGALVNHGLAIILGSLLTLVVPIDALQLIAGILFIAFGLLSLSVAEEGIDEITPLKIGAIMSVAVAFFISELGDKTQLTAMTLATQSYFPIATLLGTVSGMVVVSSVGIFVGGKFGDRIPEPIIRIFAFIIFMLFGLNEIFTSAYVQEMGTTFMGLLIAIITVLTVFRFVIFKRQLDEVSVSALKQKASDLKSYRQHIKNSIKVMCRKCDVCQGSQCLVGYMVDLLSEKVDATKVDKHFIQSLHNANFESDKAEKILELLGEYYDKYPEEKNHNIELMNIEKVLHNIIEQNMRILGKE